MVDDKFEDIEEFVEEKDDEEETEETKPPYQYVKKKNDPNPVKAKEKAEVVEKVAAVPVKTAVEPTPKAEEPKYVAIPRVVSQGDMLNTIWEEIQGIKQYLTEHLK